MRWQDQIVRIKKKKPDFHGVTHRFVSRSAGAAFATHNQTDPWITVTPCPRVSGRRVGRAVIDNDDFPVSMGLMNDACDRRIQCGCGIPGWNDNAYARQTGPLRGSAGNLPLLK